jgi:hypothetical protein
MTIVFEEVVETLRELSSEQQDILIELLHNWRAQARRQEIARDAEASLAAFRRGEFVPQSADDVIQELREFAEPDE